MSESKGQCVTHEMRNYGFKTGPIRSMRPRHVTISQLLISSPEISHIQHKCSDDLFFIHRVESDGKIDGRYYYGNVEAKLFVEK